MADPTLLIWTIDATAGVDTAWARIDGDRLTADGRIAGLRPSPYWISYALETGERFEHRRIVVESRWADGEARLDLRRSDGAWFENDQPRPDLVDALDCDLAGCPMTNTMPILRHSLKRNPGDRTLLMAFIEIPHLRVVPNVQRYTHLGTTDDGAVVRYASGTFSSDLRIDASGFVVDYPQLGRRVTSASSSRPRRSRCSERPAMSSRTPTSM